MDETSETITDSESTHPTTTHAEAGAGNPRLLFIVGSDDFDGTPPREHPLTDEVTRIGSGEGLELRLEGIDSLHAEVRHDDQDEYVLYGHGETGLGSPCPDPDDCPGHILRTGARIELGTWKMTYQRDEFADHGRPFGGRNGGEFAHQQRQPDRDAAGSETRVAPEERETP